MVHSAALQQTALIYTDQTCSKATAQQMILCNQQSTVFCTV